MSWSAEVWTRFSNAKMFPDTKKQESRHWPVLTLTMIKEECVKVKT